MKCLRQTPKPRQPPQLRRLLYGTALLALSLCISACKNSGDAVAAAQQMADTAAALSQYYDALSHTIDNTVAVNELNQSVLGVDFNDADRSQLLAVKVELDHRATMAAALGNLADSFGALTGSSAPDTAASAATALSQQLVDLKALPGGNIPIPDIIGKAAGLLLQAVQQHEIKKAAQAMDGTLAGVAELYKNEKPVYDSIARQYLNTAKNVTKTLINQQAVDSRPLLTPALRPFDLEALPPAAALQTTLQSLAKTRLNASADRLGQRAADASAAMLQALQQMSTRIHALALGQPMPARGSPFSLKTVEAYLDEIKEAL